MTVENKKTNGDLESTVSSTLAQALTNFHEPKYLDLPVKG